MNENEVLKLLILLKANFSFSKNINNFDATTMLNIWYKYLQNYEYSLVEKAIENLIKTEKYMPTLSSILEEYERIKKYKILKVEKNVIEIENEDDETIKINNYFEKLPDEEKQKLKAETIAFSKEKYKKYWDCDVSLELSLQEILKNKIEKKGK